MIPQEMKTGTIRPLQPQSSPAMEYQEPVLHKVATKIVVDGPEFVPKYQTDLAACCDLVANIEPDAAGNKRVSMPHRATVVIDCGFSMELPSGYRALVSARSGWANKGLIVTNGPGVIDPDYRGRVMCIVTNVGKQIIVINHLDRIAQMAIEPIYTFSWVLAKSLSETDRGTGGLGSTGV